jgi:hypothetical protein
MSSGLVGKHPGRRPVEPRRFDVAAENRGMDQCVRIERNDQSRYAGVRVSPKSSEHRDALLKFFSTTPLRKE